jgi:hypothetical protein
MNTHTQEKVDSLMMTSKLFTDTYNRQVLLSMHVALQCLNEAYKGGSLSSSRIDLWEDVYSELGLMIKEVE